MSWEKGVAPQRALEALHWPPLADGGIAVAVSFPELAADGRVELIEVVFREMLHCLGRTSSGQGGREGGGGGRVERGVT